MTQLAQVSLSTTRAYINKVKSVTVAKKQKVRTSRHVLIGVILAVIVSVANPRSMNTLVKLATRELIGPAVAANMRLVTVLLVRHVEAIVVAVAFPRQLHAATVLTCKLSSVVTLHRLCGRTTHSIFAEMVSLKIPTKLRRNIIQFDLRGTKP